MREDIKNDPQLWRLVVAARRVVLDYMKLRSEMDPRQLETYYEINKIVNEIAPMYTDDKLKKRGRK